jgi:L-ascorbate metabolism protein UlaG (beta-lactamase superfamily)
MQITYFGHSSFLLEAGGKRILLDPFISGNPSAEKVEVGQIRCDYIFLSHGHSDHVADVEAIAKNNPEAVIVGIWELHAHYSEMGFKTHPMNKGGWWNFDFGRVKMVQAVHSSSLPDGSYAGSPAGYVFDTPDGVLYFAGDTALTMDMQLIPLTCPPLDLAILPIGSNFTMDVHDAVLAGDFIKCDRIIGCHYDTFGFIQINHHDAAAAFSTKGKELILMNIGGTLEF